MDRGGVGLRPHAALSHFSLAMLFRLMPLEDRLPEVTVVHGQRRAPEGIHVHRTRSLHPEDVWRHHGIRTTSPERLLLDLAARLDDGPLRTLMSRTQSMRLTNLRRLARQLDRAHGRPGRARYARVLAARPPATRTELEDRVYDLVIEGGFTAPDVNVPLHLDGRRGSPIPAGPSSASSWRQTAPNGTTRRRPASTTPSDRRSSRPTASASSA
jgi:hypothetical protein